MSAVTTISQCGLKVLKGISTGLTYGTKVRFTHSFVISILFQSGAYRKRFLHILSLTYEHATKLAAFVGIYKALICLFERIHGQTLSFHSLLAGCIGGFVVFRQKTIVSGQLALYLLPRILTGASKLILLRQGLQKKTLDATFSLLALVCWGLVMWLFELDARLLQPSLSKTMQSLYKESDVWNSWVEFVPFGRAIRTMISPAGN